MSKNRRPTRGRGYNKRRPPTREVRQRFLIVCEGERTERWYFDQFRTAAVVIDIDSPVSDPVRLVNAAIDKRRREERKGGYDQVWCVFDRDEVPTDRFNRALDLASKNGIKVAYSNPAFEIWFLLHFQNCTGALTRHDLGPRLTGHLPSEYRKNDPSLFSILEPRIPKAIERAERLMKRRHCPPPVEHNPSTTVYLLVKELLRFARR